MTTDKRLEREVEHGRFLVEHGAGEIWNWTTPAGKIRFQRRVEMLTSGLPDNANVLELGCGTGLFTYEFANKPIKLTAIDISPDLLEEAKKIISACNVSFKLENAYEMSFPDNSFDAVIGSSVLHHLDIKKALHEIYRVLKPGGIIRFTEPNMLNPQIALQKNIPWLKRKLGDSPDETAFFRRCLIRKLHNHDFTNVSVIPFDFLHPAIPPSLLSLALPMTGLAERIPGLKSIAGSLFISAVK